PGFSSANLYSVRASLQDARAASASDAAAALSRAIGEADPMLPLTAARALDQIQAAALAQPRLLMMLVSALAVTALLLTSIGIQGLITHVVTERRREFGIRLALGATAGQTMLAVARSGVLLAAIGVAAGIALCM